VGQERDTHKGQVTSKSTSASASTEATAVSCRRHYFKEHECIARAYSPHTLSIAENCAHVVTRWFVTLRPCDPSTSRARPSRARDLLSSAVRSTLVCSSAALAPSGTKPSPALQAFELGRLQCKLELDLFSICFLSPPCVPTRNGALGAVASATPRQRLMLCARAPPVRKMLQYSQPGVHSCNSACGGITQGLR
jgi:hypothetical protein